MKNKDAELDVVTSLALSLTLQRMPFSLQLRHRCLEECCSSSSRSHLFYDLLTQVFLRSLQYEIVVMGVIDAFVYAHNHHRRNLDNPGNFGDCEGESDL